jgi:hypothetical protein
MYRGFLGNTAPLPLFLQAYRSALKDTALESTCRLTTASIPARKNLSRADG